MYFSVYNGKDRSSKIRDTNADTGIFHSTGNTDILIVFKYIFDRFQCLHQSGRLIYDLTVWKHLSRPDCITVADLPGTDADLLCQLRQHHFHTEAGLCDTKTTESSSRRIICIICFSVNLEILVIIRSGCMRTGSFQNRSAKGCISSGIRDNRCHNALNDTIFITSNRKFHIHRMPFRMDQNTFLSR